MLVVLAQLSLFLSVPAGQHRKATETKSCKQIYIILPLLMPDNNKDLGGSLILDFRK